MFVVSGMLDLFFSIFSQENSIKWTKVNMFFALKEDSETKKLLLHLILLLGFSFLFQTETFRLFFATIRVNLLKKVFDQELKENRKDYVQIQILPIELKFTPHVISSDPGRIVIHWAHFFSFSSFNWNSFFFFQTICVLKSHWPL